MLKSGLTDADARARKISRTLFWILHSRQPCKRDMEVILNESEQSLQRYLNSEIQIKSSELQELLDIVESSSVYRSDCEEAFDNAMRGELSLLQTGSGVASEICRSRTATPSLDTANASNESCDAEWNIFDSHDMIHGSTRRSSDVATKSSLSGAKRVVVGRPSTVSVQPRRAETLDVRPATVARYVRNI